MSQFNITAEIKKTNDEERMVYGFASVADDGSGTLIDRQGDMISEAELVKAAHRFMKTAREGKVMHEGQPKAEIVESMVLRPDVAKALGVEDFKKTAWVIGMKVYDDDTWERVKKGELKAFSIGGKGRRKSVQKDGRAGRDGDGDGVQNESRRRSRDYLRTADDILSGGGGGVASRTLTATMLGGGLLGGLAHHMNKPRWQRSFRGALGSAAIGLGAGAAARGGLSLLNHRFADFSTGATTGAGLSALGGALVGGRFGGRAGALAGAGSGLLSGIVPGGLLGAFNPFHRGRSRD